MSNMLEVWFHGEESKWAGQRGCCWSRFRTLMIPPISLKTRLSTPSHGLCLDRLYRCLRTNADTTWELGTDSYRQSEMGFYTEGLPTLPQGGTLPRAFQKPTIA